MRRLALLCLLCACNTPPTVEVELTRAREWQAGQWCAPAWPKVDVILVVDDSPSMADEAQLLAENLERIGEAYVWSEVDFRLAVVSTHVPGPDCARGRGDGALVTTSCRARLDDFVQGPSAEADAVDTREVCRATCPLETIDSPWVDRSHADPIAALTCLGQVGVAGCTTEAPLAAALRALDQVELRPDAGLSVLFIGDEDDCSRPRDATEPLTESCWSAGARCADGACVVRDDGPLLPLEAFWARLEEIDLRKRKSAGIDEQRVFVSAVAGLPVGYPDRPQTFEACEGAFPTVRTLEAVEAFDPWGMEAMSICSPSWEPVLACLPAQRGLPWTLCLDVGPAEWAVDPEDDCVATETRDGVTRALAVCRDEDDVDCVKWLHGDELDPFCSDIEHWGQIQVVREMGFSDAACLEVRCGHAD